MLRGPTAPSADRIGRRAPARAIESHTQCLEIAKEMGDRAGEGKAYGNLGNTYESLGDFSKAIEFVRSRPGAARTILIFHFISARPSTAFFFHAA